MSLSMSLSRDYSSLHTSLSSSSTPNQTLKLSSDSTFNFECKDPFLFSMPSQEAHEECEKGGSCCKRVHESDSLCDWTSDSSAVPSAAHHRHKKRQRMQTILID